MKQFMFIHNNKLQFCVLCVVLCLSKSKSDDAFMCSWFWFWTSKLEICLRAKLFLSNWDTQLLCLRMLCDWLHLMVFWTKSFKMLEKLLFFVWQCKREQESRKKNSSKADQSFCLAPTALKICCVWKWWHFQIILWSEF